MESDTPSRFRTAQAREIERLRADLATMTEQRDEAHGLICGWWRKNAVELVDDGESMYALTPMGDRAMMNDADKRAFLAATTAWMGDKEGGGA